MKRTLLLVPSLALALVISTVIYVTVFSGPQAGQDRGSRETPVRCDPAQDQPDASVELQETTEKSRSVGGSLAEASANSEEFERPPEKRPAPKLQDRITGQVLSAVGRAAISDAAVTMSDSSDPPVRTLTGVEGRFSLLAPTKSRELKLEVRASGFANGVVRHLHVSGIDSKPIEIVLRPAGTIVGRVVDGGGDPRDDTVVWFVAEDFEKREAGAPAPFYHAVVRGGEYRVEGIAEGVTYRVNVYSREGRETAKDLIATALAGTRSPVPLASAEVRVRAGETRVLNFRLGAPSTLVGAVRDDEGPAARVRVILTMIPRLSVFLPSIGRQLTDEKGEFRFEGIRPGSYYLVVDNTPDPPNRRIAQAFTRVVLDGKSKIVRKDLLVYRGIYTEGRVVDPNGRPVAGANVRAEETVGCFSSDSRSGPDGLFSVGPLTPRDFEFTACSDVFAPSKPTRAMAGTKGLTIQLRRGGTVRGHVVGAGDSRGVTVEVHHRLLPLSGHRSARTVTLNSGNDVREFVIHGLVPGRYDLCATAKSGLRIGVRSGVAVSADQVVEGVEVRIKPGGEIIVDARKGIRGKISVYDSNGACISRFRATEFKRVIQVPLGVIRLVFTREDGRPIERAVRVQKGERLTVRFP